MKLPINKILASVALNIKETRLKHNYKQEYLAAKLNISQNAYSKIELCYTKITLEKLLMIAEILEVDWTSLVVQR